MPVGEGVDVENVDVGRHDEQVLRERGEHVPWIHVQERGDVVETKGSRKRDDDNTDSAGREERIGKCFW